MNFDILIPVWGESYIAQFADHGLRSLLAPNNLPWLAQRHRVRATMLTSSSSRAYVEAHPVFRRLGEILPLSIIEIDDLLALHRSNYSTILTRAYNRAMALDRSMLDTCFVYLVGDLLFGDGAMRAIARAFEDGARACVMCSPRVNESIVVETLRRKGSATELTLTNRELVDMLIESPHATLAAKIVRNDVIHLSIAHQFFWQPEADTMVARCFLSHMLCIRPTRRPVDIAAPCDFSFFEELAPGAPYHFLDDSDDFAALEVQSAQHEAKFITAHPLHVIDVAEALSAWTTVQHHRFAEATYVFRGGASSFVAEDARVLTQSYVERLKALLPPPMPHRHHHFWLGSIGAPVLSLPEDSDAQALELDRMPAVLRRLVKAHIDRMPNQRADLAVSVADRPVPVEAMLIAAARVTARVGVPRFFEVMQDVLGPGEPILVVLSGGLHEFLHVFERPERARKLARFLGKDRTMLLSFAITNADLREHRPSRYHLNELFSGSLAAFARYRLAIRVHDLAASIFDTAEGVVIEIVPDGTSAATLRSSLPDGGDLLASRWA